MGYQGIYLHKQSSNICNEEKKIEPDCLAICVLSSADPEKRVRGTNQKYDPEILKRGYKSNKSFNYKSKLLKTFSKGGTRGHHLSLFLT